MKYLEKIIPTHDKLKHFYVFTLGYILLNSNFNPLQSLGLTFIAAIITEVVQRLTKGKNTLKENTLDIFFSVLGALGFYLVGLINSIL